MTTRAKETKGLSSFQPIDRRAGWLSCVTHIHSELGRLGRDTYSLAPYQHRILSELQGGFDEEAIARMFWWWHYDTSRLVSELERGGAKPKPRVELCVDITTKENLSVTWEPAGIVNGRPGPKCDWRQWHRVRTRQGKAAIRQLLWCEGQGLVVCRPEHAAAIRSGQMPEPVLALSSEDVFAYDEGAAAQASKGRPVDWSRLQPAVGAAPG